MDCASKIKEPKITSRRNNPWPVKARDDPVLLFDATIPWHIFYPPRFLFKKFLKDLVDQEHLDLKKKKQTKQEKVLSRTPTTSGEGGGKVRNKETFYMF